MSKTTKLGEELIEAMGDVLAYVRGEIALPTRVVKPKGLSDLKPAVILVAGEKPKGPVYMMATVAPDTVMERFQDANPWPVTVFAAIPFPDKIAARQVEAEAWRRVDAAGKRVRPKGNWVDAPADWVIALLDDAGRSD